MLISAVFSLCSTLITFAILCAPFCGLQLILCRCSIKAVRLAPLVLFGAGFLWGWQYLEQHSNWDALLGILVLFPSILGLVGSGAGWFIWKKRPRY